MSGFLVNTITQLTLILVSEVAHVTLTQVSLSSFLPSPPLGGVYLLYMGYENVIFVCKMSIREFYVCNIYIYENISILVHFHIVNVEWFALYMYHFHISRIYEDLRHETKTIGI